MAITRNVALRNLFISTTETAYQGGTLSLRTGAGAGAANAASGTELAAIAIPADGITTAANGATQKNDTWSTVAAAAGTLGHYRLTNGSYVEEGTIGVSGSGADLIVDNTSLAVGQTVTVTEWTTSV